jgi:uncharacterized OB-fold protein
MSDTVPRRPAPVLTPENEPFWAAALQGRLVVQRCDGCGALHHPPRSMCPQCGSVELSFVEAAGSGTVYSYAILHHPQHPSFDYPVVAALVDLDEGVRLVTNLVDVSPGDVEIGMAVEVCFVPAVGDAVVPVFRPAGRAS